MESSLLLIQLFLAHILTDFVLQPTSWIEHKRKYKASSYLLIIHALLAGGLSLIFLQNWELWYVAAFISITHYLIDLWKLLQEKDNLTYFLLDQLFHLVIIILAWLYIIQGFDSVIPTLQSLLNSTEFLGITAAYIIVIFPAGFLIGKATQRWQNEIAEEYQKNSLEAAGRYIGIFERILVLTFILTNNFAAIGLLIAAKSILRFSDKSET
ncbi:DUF3307 domain-containing protein [Antarcticibacterium sp. 1MA-6-2]|uniref:DUF3307 domain-containing protein n=1 Tax=Antarcticibacterium sp. 1MA-6-2 TaxID=2908210 RepID=UPI001F2A3131|nr:DUF3307 domain-containing protein [Antarcticibacterium sp. 1MA-6-2]UJH91778.1 DUF3307 domain-containing protein [Antarcticibacterium sp. 1MA-6-2]